MVVFYSCPEESQRPLSTEGRRSSQGLPETGDTWEGGGSPPSPALEPRPRQATAPGTSAVRPSVRPWGQVSAAGPQWVRPVHLGRSNSACAGRASDFEK